MRIDFTNRKEIDKLYIHDSFFEGYVYNYYKRQINFSCNNSYLKKKFIFTFNNVIFSSMQSCLFWLGGNSILVVYLDENNDELKHLIEIQNSKPDLYDGSCLSESTDYLPVVFEINSGDVLLIICESLDIIEEEFNVDNM